MASPEDAKWQRRINALLAKAADTASSEEEQQLYAAKADELMHKYGITQAQARASRGEDATETAEVWPCAVSGDHGLGAARSRLAGDVAKAMGCKTARKLNPPPHPCMTHIVGVAADLASARTLIPLIMRQAEHAAAGRAAVGHRTRSYLAGFLIGYGREVAARIRERRKAYADTSAGTGAELILASRARLVADRFAQLFDGHRVFAPEARHQAEGEAAGRRAGRTAYLGDSTLNTAARPALPGR